jgi:glycosyltransferase involved in cell wall biosynthesis
MDLPKILIFGQPFNNFTGGGITLTNLFKGWPKEKIAVTYLGHGLMNVTTDVCDTYYQLGSEEHKWIFPFNLIQRKFRSGIKTFNSSQKSQINSIQKGFRFRFVNKIFYPFLRWLGLFHVVSKIRVSHRLKNWLDEYKPEILYLQVSTREDILFSTGLIDHLKIPSVIHIMDDWPSTISNRGLLKDFWNRKIDREFRKLLGKIDFYMSISDAMSAEYEKRYGHKFIPFHNPIETKNWESHQKKTYDIDRKYVKVLYSGRIGDKGIAVSLTQVAEAVDALNSESLNVKFHIQTATKTEWILELLKRYKSVVFNDYAEYSDIPKIFSEADILVLANDFSTEGIRYLKLSMPTKASEYMISGTPVLVYASPETAVSKFFRENECGYCIEAEGTDMIIKGLSLLIEDEDLRRNISNNAKMIAKRRFDSQNVRNDFQKILTNLKN